MFIRSYVNRFIGSIHVTQNKDSISITGIDREAFFADISKNWKTSKLATHMFMNSSRYEVKFGNFFALDIYYILNELYRPKVFSRTPKRSIGKMLELLKKNTWIGEVEKFDSSRVSTFNMKDFSIYTPKGYQEEFVRHYKAVTQAYGLKGYMLDSAAGTGKTMTLLYLSHDLNPKAKKIFIVPKNSVERVWAATIRDILTEEFSYWDSLSNKPLTTDYHYYIFHYEQLDRAMDLVKSNPRLFEDTFVGLDESHNFNRLTSDRTKLFLELCALPQVTNVVWSSGTPISALGNECIPFLKCIDKHFDARAELGFRKIYGADAKRANDILRHRIGHLKFHVPSQDAITINTEIIPYNVKMPTGDIYRLDNIRGELQKFAAERTKHYTSERKKYVADYELGIKTFEESREAERHKDQLKTYKDYIKTFAMRFDPQFHSELSMFCNEFERTVIHPVLMKKSSALAKAFKKAKSVYKYPELTIRGECLGLLGKYRSACFQEMVAHVGLPELIDGAKKKTIIFTSYVDVVDMVNSLLETKGYKPVVVYGETNKDLPKLVKKFFDDPDANPLIATFQSLSTAVPLIAANRIINIDQPFRDSIKTQAIARAARLGQDSDVEVYDALLDTNGQDNISTRNNEILKWSEDMVKSILGTSNLNIDNFSLESLDIDGLANTEDVTVPTDEYPIPSILYYPRYAKELDDDIEIIDCTDDEEVARAEAIVKAIHSLHGGDLYRVDPVKREIHVATKSKVTPESFDGLEACYFTFRRCTSDDWYLQWTTVELETGVKMLLRYGRKITSTPLTWTRTPVSKDDLMGWTFYNSSEDEDD